VGAPGSVTSLVFKDVLLVSDFDVCEGFMLDHSTSSPRNIARFGMLLSRDHTTTTFHHCDLPPPQPPPLHFPSPYPFTRSYLRLLFLQPLPVYLLSSSLTPKIWHLFTTLGFQPSGVLHPSLYTVRSVFRNTRTFIMGKEPSNILAVVTKR